MISKVFVFVILTYISLAASNLAPFITKCKTDDAKCHKESTQKVIPLFADGIPELNVEQHDPLVLKHVDASTSNLKLIVTDIKVTGLKNCEAKKTTRDIKNMKMTITVLCTVNIVGKYDMKGQLFILPIEGSGDLSAQVPKIEITAGATFKDKTDKDGKVHWAITSWTHSFELKDKSNVKFENLFPDNELLRKSTEELIASNGNDVITEIGSPIIKAFVAKVIDSVKSFFKIVPVEDLALD